jgi:hypothetical protein
MTLNIANAGLFETQNLPTSKATININDPRFSVELEARPVESKKETAPSHELWGKDARGFMIKWGVMFEKRSEKAGLYYNITIPAFDYRADLYQAKDQDDIRQRTVVQWITRSRASSQNESNQD